MGDSGETVGDLLFRHPPIVELVLGVQFAPLWGFRSVHLGLFWQRVRERYPHFDERPPLDPARETFAPPGPEMLQIQFSQLPVLPRAWFLTADGDRLLQVQRDRFIVNWRRTAADAVYPSFDECLTGFVAELGSFLDFLEEEKCGAFLPDQGELTYVNQILPGRIWENHGRIGRAFTVWNDLAEGPEPEEIEFTVRYLILDGDGQPIGRVHAHLRPKVRLADRRAILEMRLTARGAPLSNDLDGVVGFLKLGHDREREVFLQLTSPEMQAVWERLDAKR